MARTVLVTGGNRGIGLAIAQAFAKQGDRVAVTHRGAGVPEGDLFGVRCDITDPAAVDAAFTAVEAELGPVEVLVANAGITDDTLLLRMSEEQFGRVLETNLTGAFLAVRQAGQRQDAARQVGPDDLHLVGRGPLRRRRPGQLRGQQGRAGRLARSITRELGTRNITANVVAPGFVETDMTAGLAEDLKAAVPQADPGRSVRPAGRGRRQRSPGWRATRPAT